MIKRRFGLIYSLVKKYDFQNIFMGSAINQVIQFVNSLIIIRLITKSSYGEYSYALNILALFSIVSGLGFLSGTFQYCCEKNDNSDEREAVFSFGYIRAFQFNCVLTVLIVMASMVIEFPISNVGYYLLLLSFEPLLKNIFDFGLIRLRYEYRNREYTICNVAMTFFQFIFGLICVIMWNVNGLIISRYFAYFASIFLLLVIYKVPLICFPKVLSNVIKKKMTKYSLISMCNNGMSQVLYLLDIFIIGLLMTNEEIIASYKISVMIPNALAFIPQTIVICIFPYFAAHVDDNKWCLKTLKLFMKYYALFNAVIVLILELFSSWIIEFLFGKIYLDAIPIVRLLLVSYFFSGTFRIIAGNLLAAKHELKFNFYIVVLSGAFNIIGDYYLIQKFGAMGASVATLLVNVFIGIACMYRLFNVYSRDED